MPSTEKIAIAAHLHVLLRRKTGRVTDTEWMATNAEYAAEIARFARERSLEDGHMDLAAWADKLDQIMAIPDLIKRVPLVKMMTDAVKDHRSAATAPAAAVSPERPKAQVINTAQEVYPESGSIESTLGTIFGDSETHPDRKAREPIGPRYVKGLR